MKNNILKKLFVCISICLLMFSTSITVFAFDINKDAGNYSNVANTNIYKDKNTSKTELEAVIKYWKLIPKTIINMMNQYNIKIYLIGDGSNKSETENVSITPVKITEDSPDLISCNDPNGPAFIEKDPYDLNNLKLVQKDGKDYILWHGFYTSCSNKNKIDWDALKKSYLEAAPEFVNYQKGLGTESESEEFNTNLSSVCATSWGASVEYDADNNYAFVKITKNGWTEYYSNNSVCFPENTLHEVGHHLDWMSVYANNGSYKGTLNGISDSKEWQNLYKSNVEKLATIDALSSSNMKFSASEGFADSFRLAYQKPDVLKATCPTVYDFIIRTVSKYGQTAVTESNFDYKAYADTYPDLKTAFGYDKKALWNHYITLGKNENRIVSVE